MKNLLKIFVIFYLTGTSLLISDNNLTKLPTLEEFQLMQEEMHNMDNKEVQEAKKAAEYFMTLIEARKEVGVKDGHSPTREQEMTIMDALFPSTKKDALKREKKESFNSKCFENAKTLNNANICVQKANILLGFISNDFTEWNSKIQQKTIVNVDGYFPCIEKSINIEELNECYKHIYK